MSAREKRVFAVAVAVSIGVGLAVGMRGASRALGLGTGGAALTLLIASLACSPLALLTTPAWSVALRAARRRLGITSALVALAHASLALSRYLAPLTLGPVGALAWLRHGALALAILLALLTTSFPRVTAALRVRAWSALHRLVYPAALLASLHALAVPFGSVRVGILALSAVATLLVVRICLAVARLRSRTPE